MKLIDTIKSHQLLARKARNFLESQLLTTLIGEAEQIGKNQGNRQSTDSEVLAVMHKFIKNIDETQKLLSASPQGNHTDAVCQLAREKITLAVYLPPPLTGSESMDIINRLFASGVVEPKVKSKGTLMKYFRDNHQGQYDAQDLMKTVETTINEAPRLKKAELKKEKFTRAWLTKKRVCKYS